MSRKTKREREHDKKCGCLSGRIQSEQDHELKMEYIDLYKACLKESYDLISEAQLLFDNKFYPRAYFLAFSALEEIAKSQLAADVFTGLKCEEAYHIIQNNHQKKVDRVEWIRVNLITINEDLSRLTSTFDCGKKFRVMYPELIDGVVVRPEDNVTPEEVENLIKAGLLGLQEIYNVTICDGNQIGTKGFMK